MGRHWLLIFHKETGNDISEVHEAPKAMVRPLIVLGIFSFFIGFINTPFFHGLEKVLEETLHYVDITHLPEGITLIILAVVSIGAGFTGLAEVSDLSAAALQWGIDKEFRLILSAKAAQKLCSKR